MNSSGKIKPVVYKTFALDDARGAQPDGAVPARRPRARVVDGRPRRRGACEAAVELLAPEGARLDTDFKHAPDVPRAALRVIGFNYIGAPASFFGFLKKLLKLEACFCDDSIRFTPSRR